MERTRIPILILTICLAVLLPGVRAQTPSLRFAGQDNLGDPQETLVDGSCSVARSGMFAGTVDFDPGPGTMLRTSSGQGAWGSSAFVQKLDHAGNFLWVATFDVINDFDVFARSRSMAMDDAEALYVVLVFRGTLDVDPGPAQNQLVSTVAGVNYLDVAIVKLDAGGGFIWARQLSANDAILPEDITIDGSSGGVYITGDFNGSVDFDPSAGSFVMSIANNGTFLLRLSLDGDFQWCRTVANGTMVGGGGFVASSASTVFITGSTLGAADLDPGPGSILTHPSNQSLYLARYDHWGAFVGAGHTSCPQPGDLGPTDLVVDGNGNALLAAGTHGPVDIDLQAGTTLLQSTSPGHLGFLVSYAPDGALNWSRRFAASIAVRIFRLDVGPEGDLVLGGSFTGTMDADPGPGTALLSTNSDNAAFVLGLGATGDHEWSMSFSGNSFTGSVVWAGGGSFWCTGLIGQPIDGPFDADPGAGETLLENGFILNYSVSGADPWLPDTTICSGSCVELTATTLGPGPFSYAWAPGIADTSAGPITVCPTSPTEYTCIVTYGCMDADTLTTMVTLGPLPIVDLGPDTSACEGTVIQLGTGIALGAHLWFDGSTAIEHDFAESTVAWVEVSVSGCVARDSCVITFLPGPDRMLPESITVCLDEGPRSVDLLAGENTNTYAWGSGETSNAITVTELGTYSVLITSVDGCAQEHSVEILEGCTDLFVPNAFTPNGDGFNDTFFATGRGLKELRFVIFDRWGAVVHSSDGPEEFWDGTAAGQPVMDGIYPWRAEYLPILASSGEPIVASGHVLLFR